MGSDRESLIFEKGADFDYAQQAVTSEREKTFSPLREQRTFDLARACACTRFFLGVPQTLIKTIANYHVVANHTVGQVFCVPM